MKRILFALLLLGCSHVAPLKKFKGTPTPGPSGVPTTRAISAGTGLTGGGTLAADRTISMPNTGPGAATYCGSGSYVTSTQLDAQGRAVAVTCATPTVADEFPFSLKDYVTNVSVSPSAGVGNQTQGTGFGFSKSSTISGCRVYWAGSNTTVKVSLWQATNSVALQTVNVTTTGAGWYTATFPGSVTTTAYHGYVCGFRDTSGSQYTLFSMRGQQGAPVAQNMDPFNGSYSSASAPYYAGSHFYWFAWNLWVNGDAIPTGAATTERYPIEPIFTVP